MRRFEIESWTSGGIAPALRGGAMSVLIVGCCVCGMLVAGCGDDAPDDAGTECPGDASVGDGCPESDAATNAGRSGGGGSGSGGRGGSGSGGSSTGEGGTGGSDQPDEDGGADPDPQTDAGMPAGGPPMDGSQLSACSDDEDCTEDRTCYVPGAQNAIGYCTGSCSEDADCDALGDGYTCNAMGGGGPGGNNDGVCRIECEGADDTSCPDMMTCVETSAGSFRCAYVEDPEDPGEQDMQLWEPCDANDDCVEGLICYGTLGGGGGPGGGPGGGGPGGGDLGFGGYCTQPCESTDECTEPEPSGNISPTCGTSNGCRFECSEDTTCPDGMECMDIAGTSRCLYPE